MKEQALTERQIRFAHNIMLKPDSPKQAAIDAGYGERHASNTAQSLMNNKLIRSMIDTQMARLEARFEVTLDRVIEELACIGFANMKDFMRVGPDGDAVLDFSRLNRRQAAALSEVTVEDFLDGRGDNARQVRKIKFKLSDKIPALLALGKHLGLKSQGSDMGAGDVYNIVMTLPPTAANEDRSYRNAPVLEHDAK